MKFIVPRCTFNWTAFKWRSNPWSRFMGSISVSYCCLTKYYSLNGLQNRNFFYSSRRQKAPNQGAGLHSFWSLQRRLPLLIFSSFSMQPAFLGSRPFFHLQRQLSFISFSLRFCFILTSSSLILTLSLPSSSSKDYCGYIRTTQIIQYNLSISWSLTNICKVPFAMSGNIFTGSED